MLEPEARERRSSRLQRKKSWISKLYSSTQQERDQSVDLDLMIKSVENDESCVYDRDTTSFIELTRRLALMFEQPEEWRLELMDDFTHLAKTGQKKAVLDKKRSIMKSLDDFDEDLEPVQTKQRFVSKKGIVKVNYRNMPGLKKKIALDFFHTIMDAKWRYFTLLFFLSFLVTWLIFAGIWYGIYVARGGTTCVDNVDSFATAFLFSIETQITIGYGGRAVTDKCPEGIIVMIIQVVMGTFITTALLGVLFAKLSRPRNRGKTIVFSKNAVITMRDGKYCLIYRYVDLRERKLLDSNMRLIILKPHLTKEGEYIPLNMLDMKITVDYGQVEYTVRLFPIYPISIIHIIDKHSPLFDLSKSDLEKKNFEIIAILEGTVPGTGNCTEAIQSYKPAEIKWGHRFKPIFVGLKRGVYKNSIDLSNLNKMYSEDATPDHSAQVQYPDDESESESSSSSSSSSGSSDGSDDSDDSDESCISKPDSYYLTNFKNDITLKDAAGTVNISDSSVKKNN